MRSSGLTQFAAELRDDLARAGHYLLTGDHSRPYELVAYRGYGNGRRALVHGRALECAGVARAGESESAWRNLVDTYKRIDATPLPHARIEATLNGATFELRADEEGFFRQWLDLPAPLPDVEPWLAAELRLLEPVREHSADVRASAPIRVADPAAHFGVISDLDDTVIQSRITSFLHAARNLLLGSARTRLPFPGVAAFYQALERGGDGSAANPIFYVSSSPWNIYDIIADFMTLQKIPVGPIHLRDWDLDLSLFGRDRLRNYKAPIIREILALYPTLPFILIGDNTQKDPEIYRAILDEHPGRILAIYIRNVDANPERSASLRALAAEVRAAGSALVLCDDTYAAATHAAEHGWVQAAALPMVKEEKRADTGEKPGKAGGAPAPESPTVVVE